MSRLRAFSIHLGISAVLIAATAAAVALLWYPPTGFLRPWDNAWTPLGIFLAAGPLLTLILFKPRKRGLLLDVVVVALLQAVALGHGLFVLYRERPAFTVFAVDRFFVLAERDLDPAAAAAAHRFDDAARRGPTLAVAKLPSDDAERNRLLHETLFEGKPDIERRPALWHPFAAEAAQVVARQRPLSVLRAAHPDAWGDIDAAVARIGIAESDLGFVPLVAGGHELAAIVDARSGEPLGSVDHDPWIAN